MTFDIDANGILHVTAKDKATAKEQSIKITASTNLDEKEVDRMVREAKEHERKMKPVATWSMPATPLMAWSMACRRA